MIINKLDNKLLYSKKQFDIFLTNISSDYENYSYLYHKTPYKNNNFDNIRKL